jgi:hypothetical protein
MHVERDAFIRSFVYEEVSFTDAVVGGVTTGFWGHASNLPGCREMCDGGVGGLRKKKEEKEKKRERKKKGQEPTQYVIHIFIFIGK